MGKKKKMEIALYLIVLMLWLSFFFLLHFLFRQRSQIDLIFGLVSHTVSIITLIRDTWGVSHNKGLVSVY